MEYNECSICGRDVQNQERHDATITDTSGGTYLAVCDECFDRINTPRCSLCGELNPENRRSEGLTFQEQMPEPGDEVSISEATHRVCDSCRRSVIEERYAGVSK